MENPHIYSDNGTNFVGAKRIEGISTILERGNEDHRTDGELGITWHFIPDYSSHFGGLWEAGVKSTKYHLRRIAGNAVLLLKNSTLFWFRIEALLNSRPLTPMPVDPNDLTRITPAHFLFGRTFTSVADLTLMHLSDSRLSR